jgi:acetyl esterase/lipase
MRVNKSFFIPFFFFSFCAVNMSMAQDSAMVIPLWKNGAPGFESKKNIPEEAKEWWVRNIHNPSIVVYPAPAGTANGSAVVICPGGGFNNLVYNAEGKEPAAYLNSLGITVFVLKYRLFRRDSMLYTAENPKQDIFRAMRLVRSRAKEFNIDTSRIGVMGFSAGGEVAGWVSYHYQESHVVKPDAVDALTARPAFQILIYPGPLAVPDSVSVTAPPTFLLVSNNDQCCSEPVIKLLQMHRKAKVPVEAHIYAEGDHGFNMGKRSVYNELKTWPDRLTDWIKDTEFVIKKKG